MSTWWTAAAAAVLVLVLGPTLFRWFLGTPVAGWLFRLVFAKPKKFAHPCGPNLQDWGESIIATIEDNFIGRKDFTWHSVANRQSVLRGEKPIDADFDSAIYNVLQAGGGLKRLVGCLSNGPGWANEYATISLPEGVTERDKIISVILEWVEIAMTKDGAQGSGQQLKFRDLGTDLDHPEPDFSNRKKGRARNVEIMLRLARFLRTRQVDVEPNFGKLLELLHSTAARRGWDEPGACELGNSFAAAARRERDEGLFFALKTYVLLAPIKGGESVPGEKSVP